jgi:hypothetical protein
MPLNTMYAVHIGDGPRVSIGPVFQRSVDKATFSKLLVCSGSHQRHVPQSPETHSPLSKLCALPKTGNCLNKVWKEPHDEALLASRSAVAAWHLDSSLIETG